VVCIVVFVEVLEAASEEVCDVTLKTFVVKAVVVKACGEDFCDEGL